MSELALRLIAENKAAHERGEDATSLDLGNCGLTELPEELFECVWLEELIVSNIYWDQQKQKWIESLNKGTPNQIGQLPDGFSKLVNLKTLYIGGNYRERWNLSDVNSLASLTSLQSLDLSENQITELGPLASLTSLNTLVLRSNQITELGPLAALTSLNTLHLSENQITELGPLASLTSLNTLVLRSNQITELGPLASLTSLNTLHLSENQITELGPLASLTSLNTLVLRSNQITELGPLASLTSLNTLDLSYNQITELGPLADLTSLNTLVLRSNQITELGPLAALTSLNTLHLSENQITELGPLADLNSLQSLVLRSNQITELGPLAALTSLNTLDLRSNQITELGPLAALTSLNTLDLSENQITELGPLASLTSLNTLVLMSNQITELGPLAALTSLNTLDLRSNQITELGPLAALTTLNTLHLSYNQITELGPLAALTSLNTLVLMSNQITELGPLAALTSLNTLVLMSNQITELGPLADLTSLNTLNLSYNQITELGPLAALTSLNTLALSNNRITELGPLADLTNLNTLHLRINQITELGPLAALNSLQSLDLRSNQITEIPLLFLERMKLEMEFEDEYISNRIILAKNPIVMPPLDVLEQGRSFAIDYLRNADKQPLNECKVIIIGRGGVGKTSLQKRLTHQPFDPKESQTHGIRKVSWGDGVKAGDGEPITVNFWDFGGQDIQQTLHQFFYSKNTVYILVLNKRHDEDPEDFLELIRTYGHNSPVLIAYNTMIKLDEEGKATYDLNPGLDSSLRSKYPNIRERTFGLCCGQEKDRGVDELRKYLQAYIPTLDHVREPYPPSWLTIQQELLSKVQSNYIHYEEYEKLCCTHQVEEQNIQKGLAGMLNIVGTITFFDRQFLGKYYILNPDWLTTGTYQIIDSEQTTKKRGKINMEDLRIIFSHPLLFKYKPSEYEFLLQLMEEFALCHYEPSREEWLIPSSLEGNSKTDLVAYRDEEHRQYNLQYEISLPASVIHRFIARNIEHAYQDDYWKNGIVVKHPDSNTTLYVEADKRERQIRLYAKGERIRDCWIFFRKDFIEFSGAFDYEELAILPSGDAVSYQYLMEAWEAEEEEVFISKKTGRVNVKKTLGLLFESPKSSNDDLLMLQNIIQEGELGKAFERIDELRISHPNLGTLKKEFGSGVYKTDANYLDRLKMTLNECFETPNLPLHAR